MITKGYLYAALALALLIAGGAGGWKFGTWQVQAKWDSATVAAQKAQAEQDAQVEKLHQQELAQAVAKARADADAAAQEAIAQAAQAARAQALRDATAHAVKTLPQYTSPSCQLDPDLLKRINQELTR